MADGHEIAVGYISIIPETSKIKPGVDQALGNIKAEKPGKTVGERFTGAVSKTVKAGALSVGATAGGVMATAFTKGFSRLTKMDQAQAKLTGLGNSAADVAEIMSNANAAVKGTAFGLDAAATTAAAAVASGIKPGEMLTRVLTTVGDTAAIAGADMAEMGSIFNGIAARGKASAIDLNRLMDRGVPVLEFLSDQLGVSAAEVSKMVSEGKVDFQTFADAMEKGVGGSALAMGDTFSGALANMGAAAGRVGAKILAPVFDVAPDAMKAVTAGFDAVGEKIEPLVEGVAAKIGPAIKNVFSDLPSLWESITTDETMAARFDAVGSVVGQVADLAKAAAPAVMDLASAVGQVAGRIGGQVWDAAVGALQVATPILKQVLVPTLEAGAKIVEKFGPQLGILVTGFLGFKGAQKTVGATVGGLNTLKSKALDTVKGVKKSYETVIGIPGEIRKTRDAFFDTVGTVKAAGTAIKNYGVWSKVAAGAQTVLNTVMKANPVGLIVTGLTVAATAIGLFLTKTETGQKIVASVVDWTKTAVAGAATLVADLVYGKIIPAWQGFCGAVDTVKTAVVTLWTGVIKPTWSAIGGFIKSTVQTVVIGAFNKFKGGLDAVSSFVSQAWTGVIKPTWDALGQGISAVVGFVVETPFNALKTGVKKVGEIFSTVVDGVKTVWSSLRSILAKPINFMINTVYNRGVLGVWNAAAGFLPGLKQAAPMAGIPEHAAGGKIVGPGTGTSDDVLMWGSAGEHMITAREVQRGGGHETIYAMRDLLAEGHPFTWQDGKVFAYRAGQPARDNRPVPQVLPRFARGGAIEPEWKHQLMRGHKWARAQSGKPYVAGNQFPAGGDCSGYMSAIASVILHGHARDHWATPAFPAGQAQRVVAAGQPWVAGLGQGFSIGMSGGPHSGGAAGHTAGTLSGVGNFAPVNVESGGGHGNVAYGGPAVGADHRQFPTRYHLAIGAHGGFEAAGGPSSATMIERIQAKIKSVAEGIFGPIRDSIAGKIGTPPPEWLRIPPAFLKAGSKATVDMLMDKATKLSDLLTSVYNKIKDVGRSVIPSFLRDTGGWIPRGLSLIRNETGKPEAVLNWDQLKLVRDLAANADMEKAAQAGGLAAAKTFASEWGVPEDQATNPLAVGAAIGKEFLGTAARSGLGLFGMSGLVDVAQSLDSKAQTLAKANQPAETPAGSGGVDSSPAATGTTDTPTPTSGPAGYAAAIAQTAKAMGLPAKGAAIGVATALVESGDPLRMLANKAVPESLKFPHDGLGSDHDSVGLFQQRSSGWGTVADRMSPTGSARMFFTAMVKNFPDWASREPGSVAQGVQRSAFPSRYAPKMPRGMELVEKAGVYDTGGILPHRGMAVNLSGRPEAVISGPQWEAIDRLGAALTVTGQPVDAGLQIAREMGRILPGAVAEGTRQGLQDSDRMSPLAPAGADGGETVVHLELSGDAFSASQVEQMVHRLAEQVDKLRVEVQRSGEASVLSGVSMMA